jgi:hypothetical protein
MKTHQLNHPRRRLIPRTVVLALLFLCRLAPVAHAQSGGGYELKNDGFTTGSGTATNGAYRLAGAFVPSASTVATNGIYSLTGGFATVSLVQTPGAPLLRIARAGGGFVLSWPDPSTGFKLQSTTTVANPASWTDVVTQPVVAGSDKTVTVPVTGPYQFYRLLKP